MTFGAPSEKDLERLSGAAVFLSFSGGKDSTACGVWLKKHGIPFQAIFADTGWEQEQTYEYVRSMEPILGPIRWVGYPGGMASLVKDKGMFPSRKMRFCTEKLKTVPLALAQQEMAQGREIVSVVGVRAQESESRSRLMRWDGSTQRVPGGGEVRQTIWRPLLEWSGDDVYRFLGEEVVPMNPLYMQGAKRVGCWPCIFARKGEIEHIAEVDPGRIDEIDSLEKEVTALSKSGAKTGRMSTFFQYIRLGDAKTYETAGDWPIRRVVRWSRTKRQKGQRRLPEIPAGEDGCVSAGLCEFNAAKPQEETVSDLIELVNPKTGEKFLVRTENLQRPEAPPLWETIGEMLTDLSSRGVVFAYATPGNPRGGRYPGLSETHTISIGAGQNRQKVYASSVLELVTLASGVLRQFDAAALGPPAENFATGAVAATPSLGEAIDQAEADAAALEV